MTEILGTVSAVLKIVEVSVKTSSQLYELFRSIKDAPQEVIVLGRDVKSFEMIVRNLRISPSSPDVERVVKEDSELAETLDHLQGPMKNCYQSCDYIQKKLHGSGVKHFEETRNNRINIGSVKWHFKRKDVYELISRFQLTRGMFSDAMGALNLYGLTFPSIPESPKGRFEISNSLQASNI